MTTFGKYAYVIYKIRVLAHAQSILVIGKGTRLWRYAFLLACQGWYSWLKLPGCTAGS